MTEQDQHDEQGGVRERLGEVVHAVHDAVAERVAPVAERVAPVTERVAPAVDAVTHALHEAGHAVTHRGERRHAPEPERGPALGPVPSGTRIVRPAKGGTTFLAWREDRWAPVRREHGSGWVWSA